MNKQRAIELMMEADDERVEMRRQRDELLQALRLLVGDMDKYLYPEEAIDTYTTKHEGKLRELLAKYTEDAK